MFKDMRGTIDAMTVLQRASSKGRKEVYWECLCSCGVVQDKSRTWLRSAVFHACTLCARTRAVWTLGEQTRKRRQEERIPPAIQRSKVYTFVGREGDEVVVQCNYCKRHVRRPMAKVHDLGNARSGCRKCYQGRNPKEFVSVQGMRVANTMEAIAKAACEVQGVKYLRLNKSKDRMFVQCVGCGKEKEYKISRGIADAFRAPKYGCKDCWKEMRKK